MPLAFANTVDSSRRVLWCDRRRPSPRSVREGDGWMAHGDARHAGCPPCVCVSVSVCLSVDGSGPVERAANSRNTKRD